MKDYKDNYRDDDSSQEFFDFLARLCQGNEEVSFETY